MAVIAIHILNASLYQELKEHYEETQTPGTSDEPPGSANDFGGAPKIADPKGLAECKQRIKDINDRIKKDAVKQIETEKNEASEKQKADEDRIKGYQDQITMLSDNTKDATKKLKTAETKIPESIEKLNICTADLNRIQPILDTQKKCCEQMRTEKDNYTKMKNDATAKFGELNGENNNLSARISEITNSSTSIINDINKCNIDVSEIQSQITIYKNTMEKTI